MPPNPDSPFPKFTRWLPSEQTPLGVMHIVDRVCGGQFLLGTEEKEFFSRLLHRILPFCGLELLTWTCLDNHYHLLVRVPNASEAARLRAALSEEEILARMTGGAFSQAYVDDVRWRLAKYRREGREDMAEAIIERLRAQMYDVSAFMHMLKRRFSAWYNKEHGRKGTLWEGRYRSVLVEDSDEAILMMSAYIDLNAVRAGIVKDPKDYRWCGYAEALVGRSVSRAGITHVVRAGIHEDSIEWEEALETYRQWVSAIHTETTTVSSATTSTSAAAETMSQLGRPLTRQELLHCRVRYFIDGIAIGSRRFVESIFEQNRRQFPPERRSGARPMRHGVPPDPGLCTLRDLQKDVVGRGTPEPP